MRCGWLSKDPTGSPKCDRKQVDPSHACASGKGVCERDRTAILNRGSGGQGQPNIGIVRQETFTPNGNVPIPGFLALVKECCAPTRSQTARVSAPYGILYSALFETHICRK